MRRMGNYMNNYFGEDSHFTGKTPVKVLTWLHKFVIT